jgi:hypothetical protein
MDVQNSSDELYPIAVLIDELKVCLSWERMVGIRSRRVGV